MTDCSLGKEHRLRRRNDFKRVFRHQNKAAGKYVVVLTSRHGQAYRGPGRIGVVVSTKVAKLAVRRHQLKRWVREWFRQEVKPEIYGMDVVVLFRRNPPDDGHQLVDKECQKLIPKAIKAADDYNKRGKRS